MATPRYKFDPVTQRYTLLTPQEQQQAEQQESGIRSLDGGGGDNASSPSGPGGNPAAGSSGTMGGFGQAAMGYGEALGGFAPGAGIAGVVGGLMADQAIAQNAETDAAIAAANAMGAPVGVGMGAFGPTATTDPSAIAGLAAMNNAVAASMQAEAANAAEAQTIAEAAEAASAMASSPGVGVDTGAAPGVSDEGGSAMGDSGAGIGDVGGGSTATGGSDSSSTGSGASDTGAADGGWRKGGVVMNYAQGGMAPQNYGRMGDSMLVHMNPREVAGLQSLARSQGTSLTVNPQTGYPEAFNLSALLPTLIGFGLTAATGGAAAAPLISGLSNAATIGLGTGALTAAATGSLKKGLMAGLGAYGGAGLGEGLVGTAAATPAPGMEGAIGSGLPTPPTPTDPSLIGNPYSMAVPPGSMSQGLNTPMGVPTGLDTTGLAGTATTAPFPPTSDLYSMSATPGGAGLNVPSSAATTARTAGLSTTPTPDKFIGNLSGKDALKYGTAALASIPPPEFEPPKSTSMLRPYDYSFNPITGAYDARPGDSSEILYGRPTFTPGEVVPAKAGGMMSSYAAGGLAAFKEGGRPKARPLMDDKGLAGSPYYEFMGERGSNLEAAEKNFAAGGRTPANGKFLMGDGDGMSDDIPATISDKQPARLADGEFVIPADVVSHIGNGSSKAGAKKLYEMMDKIRKERTGKTKQAPAIKPDRYMPA